MKRLEAAKHWVEYLSGARRELPPGWPAAGGSLLLGLWWGALLAVITAFSGQSSKFIYIDF